MEGSKEGVCGVQYLKVERRRGRLPTWRQVPAMSTDNERSVSVRNLPLLPVMEMEDLLYELFLQVSTNNACLSDVWEVLTTRFHTARRFFNRGHKQSVSK